MPSKTCARVLLVLGGLVGGCGPGLEPTRPVRLQGDLPTVARAPVEDAEARIFSSVDRNVLRSARQMVPLVDYLSRRSGIPLRMEYLTDYDAQYEGLVSGRVHLAWVSPTAYVRAHAAAGVVPLARPVRGNSSSYKSVLVVRRDRSARDLDDLAGATVAFAHPNSTSGNLFPRAWLRERGITPETFFGATPFAGTHYNALEGVARGLYDAAFVESPTLVNTQRDIDPGSYEVLEVVAEIPHGPVVAHPSLPEEERRRLTEALLAYATDPLIADLRFGLAKATRIQSFRPTTDADYDAVRRLALAGPGTGTGDGSRGEAEARTAGGGTDAAGTTGAGGRDG